MIEKIKAKYIPKNINSLSTQIIQLIGEEYEFQYAYTLKNVKFYESIDLKFNSSDTISEEDLKWK